MVGPHQRPGLLWRFGWDAVGYPDWHNRRLCRRRSAWLAEGPHFSLLGIAGAFIKGSSFLTLAIRWQGAAHGQGPGTVQGKLVTTVNGPRYSPSGAHPVVWRGLMAATQGR
jgi:hypothetical protein